ncbi:MAG: hypothetical protein IPG50_07385 [Myxococcales bacterium]|nr:hypothetical protein [Myxococcales bacterium]
MNSRVAHSLVMRNPEFRQAYPMEAALSESIPTRAGWSMLVFSVLMANGERVVRVPYAVASVDGASAAVTLERRDATQLGLGVPKGAILQTEESYVARFASVDAQEAARERYFMAADRAREAWLAGLQDEEARKEYRSALGGTLIAAMEPGLRALSPEFFVWLDGARN